MFTSNRAQGPAPNTSITPTATNIRITTYHTMADTFAYADTSFTC